MSLTHLISIHAPLFFPLTSLFLSLHFVNELFLEIIESHFPHPDICLIAKYLFGLEEIVDVGIMTHLLRPHLEDVHVYPTPVNSTGWISSCWSSIIPEVEGILILLNHHH